jgi:hypothetical protein
MTTAYIGFSDMMRSAVRLNSIEGTAVTPHLVDSALISFMIMVRLFAMESDNCSNFCVGQIFKKTPKNRCCCSDIPYPLLNNFHIYHQYGQYYLLLFPNPLHLYLPSHIHIYPIIVKEQPLSNKIRAITNM